MNRFHVHLNVADIDASVRFYTQLFASAPTVLKHDYAKWMLEDPRVNFAISNTGRGAGIDHLGIQAENDGELAALGRRFDAAGVATVPEAAATCCYARSDKLWTEDPQGTRWETFHTFGDATTYYDGQTAACATDGAACEPHAAAAQAAPKQAVREPAPAALHAAPESACCGSAKSACC